MGYECEGSSIGNRKGLRARFSKCGCKKDEVVVCFPKERTTPSQLLEDLNKADLVLKGPLCIIVISLIDIIYFSLYSSLKYFFKNVSFLIKFLFLFFCLFVCLFHVFSTIADKTLQREVNTLHQKDDEMEEDKNERINRIMEELDPKLKQSIDKTRKLEQYRTSIWKCSLA